MPMYLEDVRGVCYFTRLPKKNPQENWHDYALKTKQKRRVVSTVKYGQTKPLV